jgi:hypothetical protein
VSVVRRRWTGVRTSSCRRSMRLLMMLLWRESQSRAWLSLGEEQEDVRGGRRVRVRRREAGRRGVAPDERERRVAHTKQQLAQCEQRLHALRLQLPHQLQLGQRLLQRHIRQSQPLPVPDSQPLLVRTCCSWPERECTTASFILAKQLFGSSATALPSSSNCAIKPQTRSRFTFPAARAPRPNSRPFPAPAGWCPAARRGPSCGG